ncbi:MAG TPA: glycosyltransferase [Acidimicrobiales bacterium]|nr:glycosyltransferase [Acidimicrobiales bacterium]
MVTPAPRVAVCGTGMAPLAEASGALERAVLGWALALRRRGYGVVAVEPGPGGPTAEELRSIGCHVLVLNNRPLWGRASPCPVVHVLHNYPDAWELGGATEARVGEALGAGLPAAVSRTLASSIEAAYGLDHVQQAVVEVEECFFEQRWHGGGPVVFPNRLLEKKGVRLFLELSALLAEDGLHCVAYRHLAPWRSPTPEHRELLAEIAACSTVQLLEPPATREAMARAYAAAAVVVCPSLRPEGLGMVALEAQAVGAPVVTSGCGGLAEATFTPNETVRAPDPGEWRAAVLRALDRGRRDPGSLADASEAVRRAHGPEPAAESIERLVGEALDAGDLQGRLARPHGALPAAAEGGPPSGESP